MRDMARHAFTFPSRKENAMPVDKKYKNYPSDDKARETFTDDEFAKELEKAINSEPVVTVFQFHSYESHVELTPNTFRALADLTDSIPGCRLTASLDIVRGKTMHEIERQVLSARKTDMFYHEDSPYYMGDEAVSAE
jgi:hypothetical protein